MIFNKKIKKQNTDFLVSKEKSFNTICADSLIFDNDTLKEISKNIILENLLKNNNSIVSFNSVKNNDFFQKELFYNHISCIRISKEQEYLWNIFDDLKSISQINSLFHSFIDFKFEKEIQILEIISDFIFEENKNNSTIFSYDDFVFLLKNPELVPGLEDFNSGLISKTFLLFKAKFQFLKEIDETNKATFSFNQIKNKRFIILIDNSYSLEPFFNLLLSFLSRELENNVLENIHFFIKTSKHETLNFEPLLSIIQNKKTINEGSFSCSFIFPNLESFSKYFNPTSICFHIFRNYFDLMIIGRIVDFEYAEKISRSIGLKTCKDKEGRCYSGYVISSIEINAKNEDEIHLYSIKEELIFKIDVFKNIKNREPFIVPEIHNKYNLEFKDLYNNNQNLFYILSKNLSYNHIFNRTNFKDYKNEELIEYCLLDTQDITFEEKYIKQNKQKIKELRLFYYYNKGFEKDILSDYSKEQIRQLRLASLDKIDLCFLLNSDISEDDMNIIRIQLKENL